MASSYTAPRFGRRRVRAQQWAAIFAVLILTICGAQQATAATIDVTTTDQGVTNGQCSLQEAIYASEFKSNKAVQSTSPDIFYDTGCTAGTGDDVIMLARVLYEFDHFWDGDSHNIFGPTATPIIFSKITIEGNGATLQWRERFSPGNSRLFAIGTVNDENFPSGTGDLTLKNVYIKNFHIKGGMAAAAVAEVWGPVAQFTMRVHLESKTPLSRITERSEAEAAGDSREEVEDCSEMAVLDVIIAPEAAVVRAAMVATVRSLTVLDLEAAAAEEEPFFPVRTLR